MTGMLLETDLTEQQHDALKQIRDWFEGRSKRGQQVFKLFGYAGTGKTSLARWVRATAQRPARVRFAAYTGKAAYMLRNKGCTDAKTIHQLLYQRLGDRDDDAEPERIVPIHDIPETKPVKFTKVDPEFDVKDQSIPNTDLIIIDECSMVNEEIGRDLLSTGHKILLLGDPGQLPPVRGEGGFFMRGEPDVLLTEIHRTSAESPVLHLATATRNHEWLRAGWYGSSRIMYGEHLTAEMVLDADQIIVGVNRTRRGFNKWCRDLLGHAAEDWLPIENDKLVCLKNNNEYRPPLLNGSLWQVQSCDKGEGEISRRPVVQLGLRSHDDDRFVRTTVPVGFFQQGDVPYEETYDSFTYGYALTCHKAQGSEWRHVLVIDESYVFGFFADEEMRWRWLYTAITRASERVTIVRRWKNELASAGVP